MGRDDFVASAAYQPEPTSVAAARRFVRDTLAGWVVAGGVGDGHGLVDDAVLLTSELVTNAVVHAGTAVQVVCRMADDGVEVVVSDGDPGRMVPESRPQEAVPAERTSGRGLLLPASLASAWGVTYGRAAKAVWFRLALSGQVGGFTGGPLDGAGAAEGVNGAAADRATLSAAARHGLPAVNGTDGLPGPGPGALSHHRLPAPPGEEGYAALLTGAVESARALVGADAAYAMMVNEDGELALRAAAGGLPGPSDSRNPAPAQGPAWGALAGGDAPAGADPSVVTVPFVVDGHVTGLLAVASSTPGRFADDDALRLQRLADRCGPTLERARAADTERVRRSRIAAFAMARGLLAGGLSRDDAMALAARATVPRLAAWCAVLLPHDGVLRPALARHADDARSPALAVLLERAAAPGGPAGEGWPLPASAGALPGPLGPVWRWPLPPPEGTTPDGAEALAGDDACCFPLGPDGRAGVFVIGFRHYERLPREVAELVADLACRLGLAITEKARQVRKQPANRKNGRAAAAREGAPEAGLAIGR